MKSKASRKEIIKVKMEINKIENQYRKINKIKSFFSLRKEGGGERERPKLWFHLCILPKATVEKYYKKIEEGRTKMAA